jgi:hypothetical protein
MQDRPFPLLTLSSAVAALAAIFSVPSMAQQPADQQPAVDAGAAAGIAIGAEGVLKGEIQTYQGDKLIVTSPYYLWRGGCYVRYQSGNYQPVPPTGCR